MKLLIVTVFETKDNFVILLVSSWKNDIIMCKYTGYTDKRPNYQKQLVAHELRGPTQICGISRFIKMK